MNTVWFLLEKELIQMATEGRRCERLMAILALPILQGRVLRGIRGGIVIITAGRALGGICRTRRRAFFHVSRGRGGSSQEKRGVANMVTLKGTRSMERVVERAFTGLLQLNA